jgi:hypothetical protein
MSEVTVIGLDLAKHAFQVHGACSAGTRCGDGGNLQGAVDLENGTVEVRGGT